MSNLIIDIGSTAVKAAKAEGELLGKTYRYQGERVCDFIMSLARAEKPHEMIISSSTDISQSDINAYSSVCGKLVLVDNKIKEKYGLPDWLTPDRTATVLAVRKMFAGKGCTIIDLGTTMTIDVIDAEGNYIGGNVSLGLRARLKAINRYSRSFPLVELTEIDCILGHSMQTSIVSGVTRGIIFEIEGYESRFAGNITVFTGGDAIYFAKKMKNSIFVSCNLVLIGLVLLSDTYDGKEY